MAPALLPAAALVSPHCGRSAAPTAQEEIVVEEEDVVLLEEAKPDRQDFDALLADAGLNSPPRKARALLPSTPPSSVPTRSSACLHWLMHPLLCLPAPAESRREPQWPPEHRTPNG